MTASARSTGTLSSSSKTSGSSLTVTPGVPTGLQATDISLLIVEAGPATSSIVTPSGWQKIAGGSINTTWFQLGASVVAAAYVRYGNWIGAPSVVATSTGAATLSARVYAYQKSVGEFWAVSAAIEPYEIDVT